MNTPRRVLVIHPGAVGDVLLALPALVHLARLLGPGVSRTLAVEPRQAALLRGSAFAESIVEFERLALHRLFVTDADPAVLRELARYDAIVSWFGAGDACYPAHLARAARRAVVARAAPPPGSDCHASRHLLDSLGALGPVPAVPPPVRLEVAEPERRWAIDWLAARDLGPDEAVVLHPGAGSPAKALPGHAGLARRLAARGLPVVVVTGPADAVLGHLEGVLSAPDLTLRQLAALQASARAFVGNDSGPSHLAAAVGAPTLALFGPTDPAVWAPLGGHVTVLAGGGPGAADAWAGLDEARVADALEGLLAGDRVATRLPVS